MRAVIYCRISEDRTGQAAGVTRQLEDCRSLTVQRGLQVIAEHVDNDLSALRGRPRPGYTALMAQARAGEVDTVVVWHTSRLWRNRRERADAFEVFRQRKVSVVAVKGPSLDMATASGRMIAGILGEFDQAESEVKGERVSRAARQRAENGGNHGGRRSYGYTEDGLELIPDEADVIREMVTQVIAGVPLGAIARDLTAAGMPTVTGRARWNPTTLRQMLRPRIAGLSEYRGEVVGIGAWPAIVDEQTWRAAMAVVSAPNRTTTKGNRPVSLLAGWGLCAECGHTLISATKTERNGTRRAYYRCRRGCVGRRREWVDELVAGLVVERLSRPDARDLLVDQHSPDYDALHTELAELRARLDSAAEQFAEGIINASQLAVISGRLRERLADLDTKLTHVSRSPILVDLVVAKNVAAAWEALSLERQRAVIHSLLDIVLLPSGGGSREFDPTKVLHLWRDQ